MLLVFVCLLLQVAKTCSWIPKNSWKQCVGGRFKDWKGHDEGWRRAYCRNARFSVSPHMPLSAFVFWGQTTITSEPASATILSTKNAATITAACATPLVNKKPSTFCHKKTSRKQEKNFSPMCPWIWQLSFLKFLMSSRRFWWFGQKTKKTWSNH